jgi:hypothetical protein
MQNYQAAYPDHISTQQQEADADWRRRREAGAKTATEAARHASQLMRQAYGVVPSSSVPRRNSRRRPSSTPSK